MANIVISGDTSGSVTLSAPAVSGTTVLTLPTTSGTLVTTAGGSTVPFALGSAAAPSITFTGDTNTGMFSPGADTIAFSEGGVESMRIDSSGNVGIGNTASWLYGGLSVGTGATNTGITIYSNSSNEGLLAFADGTSGTDRYTGFINYNNTSNFMAFATNGAVERMRIDSSGNLLVGTSDRIGFCKLGVAADGPTNNIFVIQNTSATNAGNFAYFINSAGNSAGLINQTGATTVAFVTTSDYRLKENIAPMTGALDKVSALKPVTYTWKVDGSNGQGFIAHELQEVVPDCVVGKKDDLDFDGKIKPQGIDTSFLVATLTAAIQELNAKVTALEAQLGAK